MKKLFTILLTILSFSAYSQWFTVKGTDGKTYTVYSKGSVDSLYNKLNTRITALEKADTLKFSKTYFNYTNGIIGFNPDSLSNVKALSLKLDSTNTNYVNNDKILSNRVDVAYLAINKNKSSLDSLISADKIANDAFTSQIKTLQTDITNIKSDITPVKADVEALKVWANKMKQYVITFPQ